MTHTSKELLLAGVDQRAVEFRRWRRARGLRLWQMAALSGLEWSTLQRIETGRLPLSERSNAKLRRVVETFVEEMRPRRERKRIGRKPGVRVVDGRVLEVA